VSRRLDEPATLDLHFEHGAPTSVNGVPMSPAELIECVALIGSQHGIGQTVVSAQGRQVLYDAPAATVLQVAASVAGQEAAADVCLKLADGAYTVLSPSDRHALLVNA
jgi:argininosuccinate synthase